MFVDKEGKEDQYEVELQNFFKGHVVGKTQSKNNGFLLKTGWDMQVFHMSLYDVPSGEEHSRVQAHIDGDEFSAHILTDEAEYNVEVIC